MAFTASYSQANVVLPFIFIAPYYFAGKVMLGVMTQTAGAFSNVQEALSFFIDSYTTIAQYKSVVDRLTGFAASAATRRARSASSKPHIEVATDGGDDLAMRDVEVALPKGGKVVRIKDARLRRGESVLVNGPSGAGKVDAVSRHLGHLALRKRLDQGADRREGDAPAAAPLCADRHAARCLDLSGASRRLPRRRWCARRSTRCSCPQFADRLDEEAHWGQTLSLGEQQRVALGRALLAKPDWLFLDEATSALDEPLEQAMYRLLPEKLPGVTIVSIGHRQTLQAFHKRRIELKPGADGVSEPEDVRVAGLAAE